MAPQTQPPAPPPPTLQGEWRLALLRDAPKGAQLSATLTIDQAHASGAAGCSAWTAKALNFGRDLQFDGLQESRGACANDELAGTLIAILSDTREARINAGYLVLIDANGRERAYFSRPG
jgi:heat shock protein HslJ